MIEKFEMKHFFIIGIIVFSIVLVCGLYNLISDWERMRLSLKISELAMKFFYFMLILVFYKNYKSLKIPVPEMSDEELDKLTSS